MPSKRNRQPKTTDTNSTTAEGVLKLMYEQGKAQFGSAMKGFWLYTDDLCPACLKNSAGEVNFQGEKALSINGFMYRERGILIGYFLCEICTLFIHEHAQKHPYQETPLHTKIETNLKEAYQRHLSSLN
ncbi:MAG: hypothetical protein Q8L87_18990 [Anaerolineales bacterium]|nr:hypothetical protein [Anaerolineales bacterium]